MKRLVLAALLASLSIPSAALAIPDGGIELVSRPTGFGPLPFDGAPYASVEPHSISADGCKVVFQSDNDVLSDLDDDIDVDVFRVDRCAAGQPVVLVSATATGAPGDGESYRPTISADGNRVAFTTKARNLLPPGTTAPFSVVVKDIPSGKVLLAGRGHGADTPAAAASEGIISGNGNAVAFRARGFVDANNADGVTTTSDVYVRFLDGQQTVMASAWMGASGGANGRFDVSYDATRVAFASTRSFVAGDQDTDYDAYVADVAPNGTVARQLASPGQSPRDVAISQDGGTVAFADDRVWVAACPSSPCATPTQVDGAPAGTSQDIFGLAFPRTSGTPSHVFWTTDRALLGQDTNAAYDLYVATIAATPSVSLPFGGLPGGTGTGDITDDLSVVAVESRSLELPGTDGAGTQAFVRAGGQITLLSQPAGVPPRRNETSDTTLGRGALSENGRFVVMSTQSAGLGAPLLAAEFRQAHEIIVRDVVAGITTMASVAPDGAPGNESSTDPSIDGSGSRVAFTSRATNLGPGPTAPEAHVYVRDLSTGATQLVDHKPDGTPVTGASDAADLSEDGTKVAFVSNSPDLPGANSYWHAYVSDLATGDITRVDRTPTGTAAVGHASDVVLDADGSRVAFVSRAVDLGTSDPGDKVFLAESGELTYVSVPQAGAPDQNAYGLSIDGAGDHVSWVEYAPTFGYGSDGKDHVFVRDISAGSTALSSTGGSDSAGGDEYVGELDRAGRRLVFIRAATDGISRPYLRDLTAGVTLPMLPDRRRGGFGASISPDGICVGLNSDAPDVIDDNPSPDFNHVYVRAAGGACAPRPATSQLGGGDSSAGGAGVDTTPPVLSGLRMTRKRFAVRRRASAFVFTLSEDSKTSVAIARCVKPRKAARRCGRYRVVATLTRAHTKLGRNRIAFSGRIGKRKLAPGRYRATVGAVDAAGNRAVPRRVRFSIRR
jgi:Tol biopolymer transport system component